MLLELTIENVAVIEKATVIFDKGFNALTGETGAGKSILIDSINAILGNRTSKDIVRNGTEKATIWAVFEDVSAEVQAVLQQAGYPIEEQLILQREITAEGKSSCRINGKSSTASILRDICSGIINIHGQHDNQNLLDPSKHLQMLDCFAKNNIMLAEYKKDFRVLVGYEKQIKALSMDEDEKQNRIEMLGFQINEIEKSNLEIGEDEKLTQRKNIVLHSKKIIEGLNTAYDFLNSENAAVDLLQNASASIGEVAHYSEKLTPISEKLGEIFYQTQEISIEIKTAMDEYDFNLNEIEEIEQRLDLIFNLKKKYGQTIQEIIAYSVAAQKELETISSSEEKLDEMVDKRDELYEKVKKRANSITACRKNAFEDLQKNLGETLAFLNMPGIVFSLKHTSGTLTINGQDTVEFYINTNAGEAAKPLCKIASGGELSRIMLAIKSSLAEADLIDTVIYDEIDTGISGTAAGRIGRTLKNTSEGRQVICVTHTAQIAAFADRHLLIQKNVDNGRTFTSITPLEKTGRITEIARIISGDNITELALASAEEMLSIMC